MCAKQILKKALSVSGLKFVEMYSLSCGNTVPVYDVSSMHALNQVIGYAKFINKGYGEVLYRGENKLHPGLIPSLFRGCKGTTKGTAMMTQEEVAQVIAYCEENKVSYKQRLDELGIAAWMFYDAKRKYAPKQEADIAGGFLQLASGGTFFPSPISRRDRGAADRRMQSRKRHR